MWDKLDSPTERSSNHVTRNAYGDALKHLNWNAKFAWVIRKFKRNAS